MRSAWRSRSIIAATAACCRSTIAVSINSTTCCDGWARTYPTVPTTSACRGGHPDERLPLRRRPIEHRRERMAMAKQVRRVVTGHDPNGKAIVISDGPAPFVHVNAVNPEWYSTDIWRTRETPAQIAAAAEEPTLGPRRQMPDKRGTVLRINHFPPENEAVRQMDLQASRAA